MRRGGGSEYDVKVKKMAFSLHVGDDGYVNGIPIEIPDPDMSTDLQLCISFEFIGTRGSDQIVVLAHHTDVPTRLSVYSLPNNQCFRAPTAGSYNFAVFTHNTTLKAPATPPKILMRTVSTCKHSLLSVLISAYSNKF